ncbi:MAG: 50S ribosomal protein L4 [Pelagibacterales bacterium]|nr:50S ribosomal protein L4 [Pelagibacterales bacterium]
MTVQQFVTYDVLSPNGQPLEDKKTVALNIAENSSNYIIYRDVLRQQIQKKQGTVSTKTRSEVRGGGRKPWRQKGTGRARAGSNRSPLWKGGGVCFGPKPRKTRLKVNKKERRLALRTLFYNKRNSILVIDNLENTLESPKTKSFLEICNKCNINLNQKLLIIVSEKTNFLKLATRNIKNIELISVSSLNTLAILKSTQIITTPLALNYIKEICGD